MQGLLEEYKDELANYRARFPITPQRKESLRSTLNEHMDPSDYLHLEGALIYLTKSRPDIETTVSFGATHSVNPTRGSFEELIHCLKYLESTKDIGLILKAGEPNRDLILKCYVDASYHTHPDSKSHRGYCLSLSSNESLQALLKVKFVLCKLMLLKSSLLSFLMITVLSLHFQER